MRFMRKNTRYKWRDHKTNEEILNELKVTSISDKITSYKRDWTQHINGMPKYRFSNLLTKYVPGGIRNQDRHWRDSWKNETGTGEQLPISLKARL
jgi:hypothetical protein